MFGLTRREQRWEAEERGFKMIIELATNKRQAEQAETIAQLQLDLSTELKRVSSYKTLVESLESQLSHYHEKDYKLSERRLNGLEQSLISEQQMNEILTDENSRLKLDNVKYRKVLVDIVNPDNSMDKMLGIALKTLGEIK